MIGERFRADVGKSWQTASADTLDAKRKEKREACSARLWKRFFNAGRPALETLIFLLVSMIDTPHEYSKKGEIIEKPDITGTT